jgi:hypothetical protein
MLVVCCAEPLRTLRSFQLNVYNLGDAVADVHPIVTLENMLDIEPSLPLLPYRQRKDSECATST